MRLKLHWELVKIIFCIIIHYLGSFGRVRLARNKSTNEFIALKMLKKAEILRLK